MKKFLSIIALVALTVGLAFAVGNNDGVLKALGINSDVEYAGKALASTVGELTPVKEVGAKFAPTPKKEVTDWTEWTNFCPKGDSIGYYTYNKFWSGVQDSMKIYNRYSESAPETQQFKIADWGGGVDLIIDYD